MSHRDSPAEEDDAASAAADELAASAAVEHEIVTTLFDLGRQVTAVLDLDDLLHEDPGSHRPADLVRGLRGLPARRAPRRAEGRAYTVGYPRRATNRSGSSSVRDSSAPRSASQQPLLVNDLDVRSALRRVRARHGVGNRRAAAAQVEADRRAQHAQPAPGSIQPQRRRDAAPDRGARRDRARQRQALRAEPSRRRGARDARRDRPRGRVGARPRSAVRAHRAAHQATHRLPDVRHPAAQRSRTSSRSRSRCSSARSATCRASGSARASSVTRRSIASRCSWRTCRRIRATSASCPTCAPSSRSRCSSRTAASASSTSRAPSSTRSASATSRS